MLRVLSEEEMVVHLIAEYVGKDLVNGEFKRYLEHERKFPNIEQIERLEILTLKVLQDLSKYIKRQEQIKTEMTVTPEN